MTHITGYWCGSAKTLPYFYIMLMIHLFERNLLSKGSHHRKQISLIVCEKRSEENRSVGLREEGGYQKERERENMEKTGCKGERGAFWRGDE